MATDILLDPAIRNWVVFPLFTIMFLIGVLRHNVTLIIRSKPSPSNVETVIQSNLLARSRRLRASCGFVSERSYVVRRSYFLKKDVGVLQKKFDAPNAAAAFQNNPDMMQNMMKQNVIGIVPQVASMGYIGYFFSGFLCFKLPFPLTDRFKQMLQRGIELADLDPAYVSTLSYYFIAMMGMRSVFSLTLGENSATDDARLMQQQMGGGMQQPGQDPAALYAAERDALDVLHYVDHVKDAESRVLSNINL